MLFYKRLVFIFYSCFCVTVSNNTNPT